MYKSINNGASWSPRTILPGNPQVWELKIHPANPNIIYAGTYGAGVVKSTDGGLNWNQMLNVYVRSVEIAPSNSSIVYAAGFDLHVTRNGGDTWEMRALPFTPGDGFVTLAVHPQDPNVLHTSLFSYDGLSAVYKSINGGVSWTFLYRPVTVYDGLSTDCSPLKIAPSNPNIIYCGSYKSTNGGGIWTDIVPNVRALAIHPRNFEIVYAATEGYFLGVNKTTDGFATFRSFNNGLTDLPNELEFDRSGRFLHAATRSGVFSVRVRKDSTTADFDGDGRTDLSVFRPLDGSWRVRSAAGDRNYVWGIPGDQLVPADHDGDGKADVAVWRPSTGEWFFINSESGAQSKVTWGEPADIPVKGDFDKDGKSDIAVFRPSTGTWYIVGSSSGILASVWGELATFRCPEISTAIGRRTLRSGGRRTASGI